MTDIFIGFYIILYIFIVVMLVEIDKQIMIVIASKRYSMLSSFDKRR
jgi:hypothetical protein